MGTLTDKQHTRLDALVDKIEGLPTPEAIVQAGDLRCARPLDDAGRKRMLLALSGGVAAEKIIPYLEAVRDIDYQRDKVGREIHRLGEETERLRAVRSLDAAHRIVNASHLSGKQEVAFHFFAIAVGRLERLLLVAATAAGHKLPKADQDFLGSYRPPRDYYEHAEDHFPGRKNASKVVVEHERDDMWHIRSGVSVDALGRIVGGGKAADVTSRGLAVIEDIVERNWKALKPSAIRLVRTHFEADPWNISGPEAVKNDLLASAAGMDVEAPI